MSTFTKKTIIAWPKPSYDLICSPDETTPSPFVVELHAKKDEMIDAGTMSEEGGGFTNEEGAKIIRKFTTQEAAQEWINFNNELAVKYNLTMLSSEIKSI